jgi:hypothetical protein
MNSTFQIGWLSLESSKCGQSINTDIIFNPRHLLGGRKKLEDLPVIQEHRYQFKRFLNDRTRVYPELTFGDHLVNYAVECSVSGFQIPKCHPILGESILGVVMSPHVTDPIDLWLYFEDWNLRMIRNAQIEGKRMVELMRVCNLVGRPDGQILIYYQSYSNQTDQYPRLITNEEEANSVIKDGDESVEPNTSTSAPVDLISFD